MRVKCININNKEDSLTLHAEYELQYENENFYYLENNLGQLAFYLKDRFKIIEPRQIIDINGIQTEPFTHEEKKVIAVEKDLAKARIWYKLLNEFKTANDLQRIALLEIFEEMGYPKTDMVKLYRVIADES